MVWQESKTKTNKWKKQVWSEHTLCIAGASMGWDFVEKDSGQSEEAGGAQCLCSLYACLSHSSSGPVFLLSGDLVTILQLA